VGLLFLAPPSLAPSFAQIVPDNSLGTQVNSPDGLRFTIDGGTRPSHNSNPGPNLFHSFEQFNIHPNQTVVFPNLNGLDNIFTRVIGGGLSSIDGTLRVGGAANFFLLNPNGILFGANARLQLGGSFFASTAESVVFTDDVAFSTRAEAGPPLLTIQAPVGFNLGKGSGALDLQQANLNVIGGKAWFWRAVN
jgi:filamentous hemagglutinin family protein